MYMLHIDFHPKLHPTLIFPANRISKASRFKSKCRWSEKFATAFWRQFILLEKSIATKKLAKIFEFPF
jgi:hypothetical protein